MPWAPVIAGIALATAVVGTGVSIYSSQKAAGAYAQSAAAQREANRFQRQQADLQAARQKRDAIRQSRIAQASVQQSAENQGVSGSSAAIGGQASIQSQLNSNLSFLDQYSSLSDAASDALGRASVYQSKGNQFTANAQSAGAISSLAFQVFGAAGTLGGSGGGGNGTGSWDGEG